MSKTKLAVQSVITIIIFTLGSKLLGFTREMLIASKFGSGIETDTYVVALTAAGIITSLIGTAINTTMIPILSEVESKEGKEAKIEHTNNILNIVIVCSVSLVLLSWIGSPLIIKVLAKGFKGEQFNLAVKLTRIGLPIMIFSGILNVFRGLLQSEMMFRESAVADFPFNFTYIFFLIFLSNKFGIKGLMVTSVLAVGSQIVIQIPSIKKIKYTYKWKFDLKDKYIKKILLLIIPVLVGVAIEEVNVIIDRTLASNLVTGSISALNFGNRLKNLVLGIFISAITTVIFPMLANESNTKGYKSMKKIMSYGINIILLITVPATIGLILLSEPIVQIAFERGAFDANATMMTSKALIFYSIGIVPIALKTLLTRVYFSLQDTKTPMINGAIAVSFNIILNIILVKFMGHSGLALATSIATGISAFLMLYGLKNKIGSLGTKSYIETFIKSGLASVIMGALVYVTYNGIYRIIGISKLHNLISLIISVGVGTLVYIILCYVLNIKEVKYVAKKLKTTLKK